MIHLENAGNEKEEGNKRRKGLELDTLWRPKYNHATAQLKYTTKLFPNMSKWKVDKASTRERTRERKKRRAL